MANITAAVFDYRTSGNNPSISWGFPPGVSVVDLVPDDMKGLVHSHWKKFPPVNPMWHYLLGFAFIIIGISSLIGMSAVTS